MTTRQKTQAKPAERECPFAMNPNAPLCTPACALYVRLVKADPDPRNEAGLLEYEGCGLVAQVPWRVPAKPADRAGKGE